MSNLNMILLGCKIELWYCTDHRQLLHNAQGQVIWKIRWVSILAFLNVTFSLFIFYWYCWLYNISEWKLLLVMYDNELLILFKKCLVHVRLYLISEGSKQGLDLVLVLCHLEKKPNKTKRWPSAAASIVLCCSDPYNITAIMKGLYWWTGAVSCRGYMSAMLLIKICVPD